MPIMKWGTPPSGTHEDRRAHVIGHGEGVSLQHAVQGERVGGIYGVGDVDENHGLATRWSTAPYVGDEDVEFGLKTPPNPHGYRDASRMGKCMANGDTCNGNATHASELKWCAGHSKQMAKLDEQEM